MKTYQSVMMLVNGLKVYDNRGNIQNNLVQAKDQLVRFKKRKMAHFENMGALDKIQGFHIEVSNGQIIEG